MKKKTILIIEDDLSILDDLDLLLQLEGYNTEKARNGLEGIHKLNTMNSPCVILLDLMMPIMDGWQFLEYCKNLGSSFQHPILVMTALSEKFLPSKVQGQIKKPFDIADILNSIKQHCQASGRPSSGRPNT